MIELAACDFFFIAHRASTIAVAAIVVTLETQTQSSKSSVQVNLSPEAISSCLSNMKAKIDFTEDVKATIEKLRSIYLHNEQRIQDLEQDKATDEEVATYTAKGTETNVACRVATPSPTDACQQCSASSPPKLVGEDDGDLETSRKRRRRSIEIEIV
jgi:DNA repair exonuclease SbcCD ATPase subunit